MTHDPHPYIPTEQELAEALRLRLTWLPYEAFALCMERLLRKTGFLSVKHSSRRSLKGPNSLSGFDMLALLDTGVGLSQTAVMLKRYEGTRTVPKHFVSELRGTILEREIPQAIIIATTRFSSEAVAAAKSYPGRPIWLLDGAALGELMLEFRIGVVEKTNPATGQTYLDFDEDTFAFLEGYTRKRKGAA